MFEIFEVTPVHARRFHDGQSPIRLKSKRWLEQHQELWQLLVPSSGQADTAQGEVIRIADEIYRNGGANWDSGYSKMADVFLSLVGTGNGLAQNEWEEVSSILRGLKKNQNGDTNRLAELAVKWVVQNPDPMKLGKQAYDR